MHEFSGLQNHRAVTGPMSFKKSRRFVGKPCSRDFGAPGCHQSTLFVLTNTVLASKGSVETICMNSVGYRTHRGVTGPMSFKKKHDVLSENRAPGLLGHLALPKHFI